MTLLAAFLGKWTNVTPKKLPACLNSTLHYENYVILLGCVLDHGDGDPSSWCFGREQLLDWKVAVSAIYAGVIRRRKKACAELLIRFDGGHG